MSEGKARSLHRDGYLKRWFMVRAERKVNAEKAERGREEELLGSPSF